MILVIVVGRRDRFYGLIRPDRALPLRDVVQCMVVILPLEIPAAAIFHVYPRQPRVVLDVAFNKHFGSRFDGLRYFVTTVCTDL